MIKVEPLVVLVKRTIFFFAFAHRSFRFFLFFPPFVYSRRRGPPPLFFLPSFFPSPHHGEMPPFWTCWCWNNGEKIGWDVQVYNWKKLGSTGVLHQWFSKIKKQQKFLGHLQKIFFCFWFTKLIHIPLNFWLPKFKLESFCWTFF